MAAGLESVDFPRDASGQQKSSKYLLVIKNSFARFESCTACKRSKMFQLEIKKFFRKR